MYFLMITNPQHETTRFVFDDLSKCEEFIEVVEDTGNPCLYRIYSDEFEAIKRSHKDTRLIDAIQEQH